MNTTPAHWIKENKSERVPKRLIVVTVRPTVTVKDGRSIHSWGCAVASFSYWTNRGFLHAYEKTYYDVDLIWQDITKFTAERQRTVLYVHNAQYVLRIMQMLTSLPGHGFSVVALRASSQGTWSKWRNGERTLTVCDSASIFTCSLETLATRMLVRRSGSLVSPYRDALLSACAIDCRVLTKTIREYWDWLRTGVAGNFGITGSTQSWNHFRHRFMTHRILVHDDMEARQAEREAMHAGRAENYRWGKDSSAPIFEYDYANSYPRLARDFELPSRLLGPSPERDIAKLLMLAKRRAVLIRCRVSTEVPVVPCRTESGILWPVGTFETTLWDPEWTEVIKSGGTVEPLEVWVYQKGPVLKAWAEWMLNSPAAGAAWDYRWQPMVLKHWSRALIGRFALRYQEWEVVGDLPDEGWGGGLWYDSDTNELSETMMIGRQLRRCTGFIDGDNSCPQVTSYVTSLARQKLWQAMNAIGVEHIYYVDTDSLYVNAVGRARILSMQNQPAFSGLRLKSRARGIELWGPKALFAAGVAKVSGLPLNAERITDQQFNAEVYSSLESGLRSGRTSTVETSVRTFKLKWNEARRARCSDGTTVEYRLPGNTPNRATGVIPPTTGDELARYAVRALRAKRVETA